MRPFSIHTARWRYLGAFPDANFNFQHLAWLVRTRERGRFDAFTADHLAVLNMPMAALRRSATVTSFDPLTLLPALAVMTPGPWDSWADDAFIRFPYMPGGLDVSSARFRRS